MFSLTQDEITKNWKKRTDEEIAVSIKCMVYNQEKYIEKTLDSFLSQKTDFPFQVVVHDDASTDRTAEIIMAYAKKYPRIILPIIEEENLYRKSDGSWTRAVQPYLTGKYQAICEGDDYWCDANKLQKQFDFMEAHPECSLCTHNTLLSYIDHKEKSRNFNNWTELHKLSQEDIFFGWLVHTSSYFLRSSINYKPEFSLSYWSGDYVYLTIALYYGDVYCFPEVMSVYNAGVSTGATATNHNKTAQFNLRKVRARIDYLEKYNEFTNKKFDSIVQARIAETTIKTSDDYAELKNAARTMRKSPHYKNLMSGLDLKGRLKMRWKYGGAVFGRLWYKTVIDRHKKEAAKYSR